MFNGIKKLLLEVKKYFSCSSVNCSKDMNEFDEKHYSNDGTAKVDSCETRNNDPVKGHFTNSLQERKNKINGLDNVLDSNDKIIH